MENCKIIAHRGVFDNETIIENTIPSFQKALKYHYPIELDVQLTSDDEVVVFHDDNLLRLAGKPNLIQKMDYPTLSRIPLKGTDSHIPLLRDVLKLVNDEVFIDIEIKRTKHIDKMIVLLMKELEGYHNFMIKSFDPRIMRKIKKQFPNIQTGLLIHDHYDNFIYQFLLHTSFILRYSKCDIVAISKKLLKDSKMMKKLAAYPIFVWTIKEEDEVDYSNSITYVCNNLPYKK